MHSDDAGIWGMSTSHVARVDEKEVYLTPASSRSFVSAVSARSRSVFSGSATPLSSAYSRSQVVPLNQPHLASPGLAWPPLTSPGLAAPDLASLPPGVLKSPSNLLPLLLPLHPHQKLPLYPRPPSRASRSLCRARRSRCRGQYRLLQAWRLSRSPRRHSLRLSPTARRRSSRMLSTSTTWPSPTKKRTLSRRPRCRPSSSQAQGSHPSPRPSHAAPFAVRPPPTVIALGHQVASCHVPARCRTLARAQAPPPAQAPRECPGMAAALGRHRTRRMPSSDWCTVRRHWSPRLAGLPHSVATALTLRATRRTATLGT